MAGFELDSDLKKRLNIAKGQWDKVGSAVKTGLDTMHATGPKTGVANAAEQTSAPVKAPAQERRIVKPKPIEGVGLLKSANETPAATSVLAEKPVEPRKPSFNAQDTLPKAGASPLRERYKKNAMAEGPSFPDTQGSMYIKDPTTGKNIPREGYFNEAGTFIPGPRIKPHELGTIIKHATAGVSDPAIRKIIAESIGKQGGTLDPESGRIGSELQRTGEQKLEGIKGRYLESVAKIGAQADVTSAGLRSDAIVDASMNNDRGYASKGYESVTDEQGNLSVFDKDTGTYSKPGTELSPDVKASIDRIRSNPEKMKQFYIDNEAMRPSIRAYLESSDSFR